MSDKPTSLNGKPLIMAGKPTNCCCNLETGTGNPCVEDPYNYPNPCDGNAAASCLEGMGIIVDLTFDAYTDYGPDGEPIRKCTSSASGTYLIKLPGSTEPCATYQNPIGSEYNCLGEMICERVRFRGGLLWGLDGIYISDCVSCNYFHFHISCCSFLGIAGDQETLGSCCEELPLDPPCDGDAVIIILHGFDHDAIGGDICAPGLAFKVLASDPGPPPTFPITSPMTVNLDVVPHDNVDANCKGFADIASASFTFFGPICGNNPPDCGEPYPNPEPYFEATYEHGCYWTIGNISVQHSCDIIKAVWSDGDPSGLERTSFRLGNVCDGPQSHDLTLTVIDSRGCYGSYTVELSCGCECPGSSGSEPTLVSVVEGENGCTYTFDMNVSDPNNCGPCIEWLVSGGGMPACAINFDLCDPCTGSDPDDPLCNIIGECVSCSDGEISFTITGPATLLWRFKECPCACPGEFNEIELPCSNCDCCEEYITGALVELGVTDGSCECDFLDGTYVLEPSGGVGEEGCVLIHSSGPYGPVECQIDVHLSLTITCTTPGEVSVFLSFNFGAAAWEETIEYTGTDPPSCLAANGLMAMFNSAADAECSWDDTTAILTLLSEGP